MTDPDSGDPDRNDWFDLAVEVSVDGETIEFARLFSALSNDEELLVLSRAAPGCGWSGPSSQTPGADR
ncbi:MAG: hypothetical protein R2789_13430 [Microthrixaceae bacterium]